MEKELLRDCLAILPQHYEIIFHTVYQYLKAMFSVLMGPEKFRQFCNFQTIYDV